MDRKVNKYTLFHFWKAYNIIHYLDGYPQSKTLLGKNMNQNMNYGHEGNMNPMNIINPQPTKTLKSNSSVFIPSKIFFLSFKNKNSKFF